MNEAERDGGLAGRVEPGEAPPPPWGTAKDDEPRPEVSLTLRTRRAVAMMYTAPILAPFVLLFVASGVQNGEVLAALAALVAPLALLLLVRIRGLPGRPFVVIEPTELRWVLPLSRRPVSIDGLGDLYIARSTFRRVQLLRRQRDGRRLVNLEAMRRSDVGELQKAIAAAAAG